MDLSRPYWDPRIETLSAERRWLLQEHRLHWQVRRCWDASAWQRDRLRAAGVDPTTFGGIGGRARIPILTLDELAGAPAPDLEVAPDVWIVSREQQPGLPARALTDGDALHRTDLAARALWAASARPGQPLQLSLPVDDNLAEIVQGAARRIGMHVHGGTSGGGTSRPPFIVGRGARAAADATTPTLAWAEEITTPDFNGVSAFRTLTIPAVAPTVGYECAEQRGLHWADDHFLVETVDPATRQPLQRGAYGALVLTEITREGSPLLRFWTGLAGSLEVEACACGRTSVRSPLVRALP